MYRHQDRARSGPHSIHDSRQFAWSLLLLGPGAPAPRQRVHPGLLPDVYIPTHARGGMVSRIIALFRSKSAEPEAALEPKADAPVNPAIEAALGDSREDTAPLSRAAAE